MTPGLTPEPLTLTLRTLPLMPPLEPVENPELLGLISAVDDGTVGIFAVSPGTTPEPDLRAMSARIAPNHLISSSSFGAQRSSVRLVVTTLKVWSLWLSSGSTEAGMGGEGASGCR